MWEMMLLLLLHHLLLEESLLLLLGCHRTLLLFASLVHGTTSGRN